MEGTDVFHLQMIIIVETEDEKDIHYETTDSIFWRLQFPKEQHASFVINTHIFNK